MMKSQARLLPALLVLLLAACGGPGADSGGFDAREDAGAATGKTGTVRTVVAAIDTGINMYHAHWYAGSPIYQDAPPQAVTQDVLDEFGIGDRCILELTRTGDFATDFETDTARGEWRKAEVCDVVWFRGTNVVAKSISPGSVPILPDDEGDTHGMAVSGSVLNANPETVLLFLEGISDEAETFAFNHPAVDFVTTSYGPIGSIPLPGHITDSFSGTFENGKLHFGACDNTPALSPFDSTCGPWWSVGISGFEENAENESDESSNGRQSLSGSFPDFIADFTQTLPRCQACEDGYREGTAGTSFASPRSAGIASRILLAARRIAGHGGAIDTTTDTPLMVNAGGIAISNWQLRRALEAAAWVPDFGSYDPLVGLTEFGPGLPVPPEAPWLLVGWGVITDLPEAGVIERTMANLGLSEDEPVSKPSDFCSFNSRNIELRKIYWDTLNVDSQTFMNAPQPDPYIPC